MKFENAQLQEAFAEAKLPLPERGGAEDKPALQIYMLHEYMQLSSTGHIPLLVEPARYVMKTRYGQEVKVLSGVSTYGGAGLTNIAGDVPVSLKLATERPQELIDLMGGMFGNTHVFFMGVTNRDELVLPESTKSVPEFIRYTGALGRLVKAAMASPETQDEAPDEAPLQVGQKMEDGTIFAGVSPDTHKPMFAAPQDEARRLDFNQAAERAREKSGETGKEYRVPSDGELKVLFAGLAGSGGFKRYINNSGSEIWYWSSRSVSEAEASAQRFSDGYQHKGGKDLALSVRLVRS